MSKTVLCVLLKVLMLAGADTLSKYPENSVASRECDPMCPDSDLMQDIPVSENNDYHILQNRKSDRSHSDSVSVRNKVDKIPFANISVIPESIESILSKPTSPRAFVEFHNGFLNEEDDISVTYRWNQPEFTDEIIQGYTVQCWFIENQKEIQICNDKSISATILECTVHNLKPSTTYYFQVRVHTKVGAGLYTDMIDVSTTHENPIPQVLMITRYGIDVWDLDLKITVNLVKDKNVRYATYSIAEQKIYWSNNVKDRMILKMNENNITKIAKLQNIARYLCIDWVARNLYWMEFGFGFTDLIKLDITMWENGIVKYDKILKIRTFRYSGLTIFPSMGTLYWTNYTEDNKYQMIQLDLDGNNTPIIQNNLCIICPFSLSMLVFVGMKIDGMDTKKPLIFWLFEELLILTDINFSMCNLILRTKDIGNKLNFKSLTVDKINIYITVENGYDVIYILKKKYALLKSVDAFKYIQKIRVSFSETLVFPKFYALGKSLQSYPSTRCLTLDKRIYNVEKPMYTVTTNSIIVNLPEPIPKNGCKRYNLPATLYTIYINYCLDNNLNKFDNFTVQTYKRYYEIQNLTPFAEYKLLLTLSNFYSDQLSMYPLFGSEVILKIKPSKLEAPEDVTVEALTPTIAAVYWMPPKKLHCVPVIYKVYWTLFINTTYTYTSYSTRQINELFINKTEHKVGSKFFTIIEPLIPGQKYRIYVRMYPANFSDHYNDSLNKTLYMYSEPNNITLSGVSINGMNISWIPSVNMIYYLLEYKNVEMQEWQIVRQNSANIFEPNNGEKIIYYIKNLLPGTLYKFRLILKYPKYEKDFIWPSDKRFTFSTLTNDISSTSGISVKQYYLSFTVSLVAIVTIICICYLYYLYRQRKKDNEQVFPLIMTDIELAILHEIPKGNIQFNTLYSPMLQYNSDEYVLTKIKREEIRLEKLLGSGEFGMVYRGTVKILERPGIEIPAAIKMLRKNASLQEKKRFLEEARLMNHFRHKHVLRLLAVFANASQLSTDFVRVNAALLESSE
ncbi:proto-oncogene tyrosine-protein kinase ROS-like [Formica exsecta]|uniref:proto-oncogene tyrosine-protein kinase ROS-like n=1 Tax=Formica exsecta TaxID=72781 RepID=UPI001145184D|nr:proto-oncogene tyrosine-protein kinase ROS-like [Formica exsecta]